MSYRKLFAALVIVFFTITAHAGSANDVAITKLGTGPYYESVCGGACVFIKVTPTYTGHASCATNTPSWDFVLLTSTEGGKQAYSHLLASHLSGKNISIAGKGTCIPTAAFEEVHYFYTPQ